MTTRLLLDTELMYLPEEDTSVATTVGTVDSTRLSTDRPVRPPRSHAFQRHYPGLFSSATTGGHILDIIRLMKRSVIVEVYHRFEHRRTQKLTTIRNIAFR